MKDVYIVLVVVSNTVEIDSVFWNDKKAQNRANEIAKESKAKSYVIKKWVNPSIVLSPKEYTKDRMMKLSEEFCYPIIQDRVEISEGTLCLFDKIDKIKNMYPKTFEWMQDKASWKCMPLGAVLQSYENHINKLMDEEGSDDMTEQEAVERLKCMRLFMQINDDSNDSKFLEDDYIANDMAIKALEKQIPKKCNIRDRIVFREGEYEPIKIKSYRCPICNHETGTCGVVPNYCMSCGHKIESRCEDDI